MNEAIKRPYCHKCSGRHFKNEPHMGGTSPIPKDLDLGTVKEGLVKVMTDGCPVCAERRMKQAARMKRYREKRRAKA